jgi:hypothetical protein
MSVRRMKAVSVVGNSVRMTFSRTHRGMFSERCERMNKQRIGLGKTGSLNTRCLNVRVDGIPPDELIGTTASASLLP